MKGNYLSVLKNAKEGAITYYSGNDPSHISHLKNCTLICQIGFTPSLPHSDTIEFIHVENPQLEFYQLSKQFKKDYLETDKMVYVERYKSYIHVECKIGQNVEIGPGCVIGNCTIADNVEIHANITIHSETIIGKNTIIESGTVIGSTGVMWVWNKGEKVYLEQLGNVVIAEDCRIGSLIEIVRGSANESTVIDKGTCIAHGTLIGHGCYIGKHCHFANGIKLGGSVYIADYTFLGCGVILSPGAKIKGTDIIIGAGSTVIGTLEKSGVYVGTPARWLKNSTEKLSGVPKWKSKSL
ncbi:MAG: hypothetical protein R3E32_20780 [Chitinophagales bacterium]